MDVNLPAFAHRVTVLGSTRNMVATSAGVSNGSASGVRADICAASPPCGPATAILRLFWRLSRMSLDDPKGAVLGSFAVSPDVTIQPRSAIGEPYGRNVS